MAKTKAQEMTEYDPEVVELMIEYKKGWSNLANATRDMAKLTGLMPEVCKALLELSKRNNVVELRGYSKTPEILIDGKKKKAAQRAAQLREAGQAVPQASDHITE